jgi:hypothetical protein
MLGREGETQWIAQRTLQEGGRCGKERPAGMGDGRQAANREGGGRLTALRWQQNRREEWMRLAEGREGAPSPKSVTRKSLGRNKVNGHSESRRK